MAIMLTGGNQTTGPLGQIMVVAIMKIPDLVVDSGTTVEVKIGRMMEIAKITGQLGPDVMFVVL